MVKFGYALSSEEHTPEALVRYATMAEETGFDFAMISDHFHPWLDVQGQSSFVWSVLGAIAVQTRTLQVGTGVTCPMVRTHPAIIAQAAATVAAMMPGRFLLGLGSGENLNEHVVGAAWPPIDIRHGMLIESIEIIRELWSGQSVNYRGEHYRVDSARLYTLPPQSPPIYIAAGGPEAATLAGEHGDGLISTSEDSELMDAFRQTGNKGPRYGQISVCWAPTDEQAAEIAFKYWPSGALKGKFKSELPLPVHFEEAISSVRPEDVTEVIVCSVDPEAHLEAIRKSMKAGFDHVYVHQIGPEQDGFFDFYSKHVLPHIQDIAPVSGGQPAPDVAADKVAQASWESFPASDAPAWRL